MHKTALKLLNTITDRGYKAYIVGGYPRDLYLKRDCLDVDITTNATPKELKEIFNDILLPNEKYGSVTVILNKIRFEITTFRKDIKYENNRQPVKIKYIDNLTDDLKRRDFTINTLCINDKGDLIDLLNSKPDLDNKLIKMVGNPKYKLKEDVLRILRAIRFATILDFKLDDSLKKYIKKYGYLIKKLSYYRKKEELDKIFSSPNIKYGISLIKELELDKHLELKNLDNLVITTSSVGIWAQLDVMDIYSFTNNEKELITKINDLMNKDLFDKKILYNYGLYLTTLVGEIKNIDRIEITKKYNELPIKSKNEINISANQICSILNRKPNSFLKEVFDLLENKILNNELKNNYEDLERYIKERWYHDRENN